MAYVSGYDYKPGQVGYWGNGDGRFIYPPRHWKDSSDRPLLEGPVTSIRWENLRDGMEDYEYLWLLRAAIEKAAKANKHGQLLAEANDLLKVPDSVSKDLTHFAVDPHALLARRDRVASMIERLK
jgi:hypothetical protein